METEAIVVGAGPTGLMVANELGLAGVRAVVVEKLHERSGQSKAGGLAPRTVEILDLRGLLDPVRSRASTQESIGAHFGGLPVPLDCRPWKTRHPYGVSIAQGRVEQLLEGNLARYGIPVLRGHEVVAIDQDADGVTATTKAPAGQVPLRGRYLVGCDGGHSSVRKLVGVAFPGQAGTLAAVVADVVLGALSPAVPTRLRHFSEHVRAANGYWTLLHPLEDGVHRLVFGGPPQRTLPREAPVTEAEVGAALQAVYGNETELRELHFASRFSDAIRQVERYQVGRVLLAGDAAHIHLPLGGQGLNLGVQDAFNLGWRLAATLRGWASDGLLDTYHTERHPVAARVLHHIRAQAVLARPDDDQDLAALRDVVTDLVRLPDANRYLAGMMSGLDIRYEMPDAVDHPLLGARMPDLDLTRPHGPTTLSRLLHAGRGLLLDLAGDPTLAATARGWAARVDYVAATTAEDVGASAVLVRPDGYVCWADTARPDQNTTAPGDTDMRLVTALARWFGAAASV